MQHPRSQTVRLSTIRLASLIQSLDWWPISGILILLAAIFIALRTPVAAPVPQSLAPVGPVTATVQPTPTSASTTELASMRPPAAPITTVSDLVVYGAPDDATAFNVVRSGTPYAVVARSGATWLQINVGATTPPNLVWIKADALIGAVAAPDIATAVPTEAPAAPVQYVIYQPPAAALENAQAEPTAAPEADGEWLGGAFYPTRHDAAGNALAPENGTPQAYDPSGRQIGAQLDCAATPAAPGCEKIAP